MIFCFCLTKSIYCKVNHSHDFLLSCRFCPKGGINFYKLSNQEAIMHQYHYLISLINIETNSILANTKVQVLKDISFLYFNHKRLFKNSSELMKFCLVISSAYNIISRNRKIQHVCWEEFINRKSINGLLMHDQHAHYGMYQKNCFILYVRIQHVNSLVSIDTYL